MERENIARAFVNVAERYHATNDFAYMLGISLYELSVANSLRERVESLLNYYDWDELVEAITGMMYFKYAYVDRIWKRFYRIYLA